MNGIDDREREIEALFANMYEYFERTGDVDTWRRTADLSVSIRDRLTKDAWTQTHYWQPDPCLAATLRARSRRVERLHQMLEAATTIERRRELLRSFGHGFSLAVHPALNQ